MREQRHLSVYLSIYLFNAGYIHVKMGYINVKAWGAMKKYQSAADKDTA